MIMKNSNKIVSDLMKDINAIAESMLEEEELIDEDRGRTSNAVRFVGSKSPLLHLAEMRKILYVLCHSPKPSNREENKPPLGLPNIMSFFAKEGFNSKRSKIVLDHLDEDMKNLQNLYKQFKSEIKDSSSQPEDTWSY